MPITLTRSRSPGASTSPGAAVLDQLISDTWTMPSTPGPIATNAPKGMMRVTLPSSTSPGFSVSMNCLRSTSSSRSSSARRDTTMLRPFSSKRVIRNW